MKYAFTPTMLCRYRAEPDAACRNRPRCRRCNKRLPFGSSDVCPACRNVRDVARARFSSMVTSHLAGDVTGAVALASGLNAVRVGALAGLGDRTIMRPFLEAVPNLLRAELQADLKAALAGIRATEGGAQ